MRHFIKAVSCIVIALSFAAAPNAAEPPTLEQLQGIWFARADAKNFHLLIEKGRIEAYIDGHYAARDSGRLEIANGAASFRAEGHTVAHVVKLRVEGGRLHVVAVPGDPPRTLERLFSARSLRTERALQGAWAAYGGNGLLFSRNTVKFIRGIDREDVRTFRIYGNLMFLSRDGKPQEFTTIKLDGDRLEMPGWDLLYRRVGGKSKGKP